MKFKGYEINELIYEGKDTLVYGGYNIRKEEKVILKTLSSENLTLRNIKKLNHEYEITQKVNCIKGVIKAYDLKKWKGKPFLIREYFSGNLLKTIIKNKRIRLEEFFNIAVQLIDILSEVHKNKVVHLDLNPNNILINNEEEIKLIDFGSSILITGDSENQKDSVQLEGTLEYIAPEQTGRIHKVIDYRSDYYSLGVTFYQLLIGKLPFNNSDKLELIYAHIAKEAVPPVEVDDNIPEMISNIVMKLMSKTPEDRYQSLVGLKRDITRCQESFKSKGKVEYFRIEDKDISDRFQIPKKLYGREEEIKKLFHIFEKINEGGKELILVEGETGIGKTTFVNQIYNKAVEKSAYFICGKFEEFKKDIPYGALIQALENFINRLLTESSEQLAIWRKEIIQAVGNNGQVITEVIPFLKLIIGQQNAIPQLGRTETQNRFNIVFEKFINIIAKEEHPLILFIDDLQWADSASLNFIKMLMINKSIQHLLIIGACREEKGNLNKPLIMLKNELIKSNANINTIGLDTLKKKDIELMLKDTLIRLGEDLSGFEELSQFVYNKTNGNPFFARHFLQSLYDKKYIWFDYNIMQWCWDIVHIRKSDITENVIEMLIKTIKTLNPCIREELTYAACIGNLFDLETLALINNTDKDSILIDLQVAVNKGLIFYVKSESADLNKGNIKFEFLHDRIQQAVYSLMTEEMRQVVHLRIGRVLLKKYSYSPKMEQLFEIVRHFNAGKSIISDKEEYMKLAELNFKAGMASKRTFAYKAAFNYYKMAVEMLDNNTWEEYYEFTLRLYSNITEMSYVISDYEKMNKYGEEVLINAKTLVDKVKIYNIKIQAYQAQLKLKKALEMGILVLKLMGIDIALKPKQADADNAFANVKQAMSVMKVEDILNLPSMSDPVKLAAMEIMLNTISAAYKTCPRLTHILASKMVEISIKHGNSHLSAGAYTFYGILLCTVINDIELGCKFGKLSIKILEKQDLNQYKAIVLDMNGYCIKHWEEHLSSTLDLFIEGYRAGMENGNFESAACCLAGHAKNSFYLGKSLKVLEEEIQSNIKTIEKIKKCSSLNYIKIFGQFVLNIQGKAKNTLMLIGEICDENKMFSIVRSNGDILGLFFLFLSKTILYYNFGQYSLAVETAKKAEENLSGALGMFDVAILYYFDSLSRLQVYSDASNKEKKEILKRVSRNQVKMKYWSKYAPMNFLHKFYLVEAERLRVIGKKCRAVEYYDKAISMAKQYEYINDEALANELAAKFWFNENKNRYAKVHLKEAYFGYKKCGAEAKVKDLQNRYIQIFHEKFQENRYQNQTTMTMLELIDINTIMKASQAISEEIVLDDLIKKLIKIIIENVGAQKAIFIMKEEDSFVIKGKKEIEEEKITAAQNIRVEEYDKNIPVSIINYVSRTKKSVILENSINSTEFSCDKYIINRKPKSVLCFPLINKRELKGIIYLENNLMTGAFTSDRLKVLEILSSQIVISLENANLYKNLERSNEILDTKVKERTAQIKDERDRLKKYLDIAEVSFLVLDKNGKVVLVNRKTYEILGYCEEELLGTEWIGKIVREDDREEAKNSFQNLMNGKSGEYLDEVIVTKNGEERMMSTHNVGLKDKEGNIEGTLSCAVDVTEHRLLREQLEYNKLKLEFFANLSHELKTPLNLSFCALQMLNLYRKNGVEAEVNEKLDKYSKIIKQNNYRLLKLVNNIVDITKINANSFDLIFENHDIVDLIRNITYSVSEYVENKNRILEFNSNIKSRVIACDPFSIERIILNLLSNSVKFTDEGDKISVNIFDKEDSIAIVVKDTGIGIPKEKRKMIFERFRQVDKSFTRNSEGSGIGLTIVKLLIELHHGEISVKSHVGEFTEFFIDLPVRKFEDKDISINDYNAGGNSLIDRIDIEFSDVYGL